MGRMRKKIFIFVLIFSSFFILFPSYSEVIKLKNGKTIKGKILLKTDILVKVKINGISISYFFDEIDSINDKKIDEISLQNKTSEEKKVVPQEEKSPVQENKKYQMGYDIDHVLAMSADCVDAYLNLGASSGAKGDYDQELAYYQKALAMDPDYPELHYNIGVVYYVLKQYQKSKSSFEKAKELFQSASNNFGVELADEWIRFIK